MNVSSLNIYISLYRKSLNIDTASKYIETARKLSNDGNEQRFNLQRVTIVMLLACASIVFVKVCH